MDREDSGIVSVVKAGTSQAFREVVDINNE
jgi:hypothetical protein